MERKGRYWRNLFRVGLLGGLILFYLVYPWAASYGILHPERAQVESSPGVYDLVYEVVSFSSTDGVFLSGWYIPSQNGANIILSHSAGANREQLLPHAAYLAQSGYGVLLYDARSHGNSQGEITARGWLEKHDVLGALNYLQRRSDVDPARIGALGYSMGGEAVLRAAIENTGLRALVADMPTGAASADAPENLGDWLLFPTRFVLLAAIENRVGVDKPPALWTQVSEMEPRPLLIISDAEKGQADLWLLYMAASDPKELWGITPPPLPADETAPRERRVVNLWKIPTPDFAGGFSYAPEEYLPRVTAFFDQALLGK